MNIFLLSLIIPIVSFFFQSYPRFFNHYFGVDVWTRMLETDHIRKNKHKIPKKQISGQFIIPGFFDYPPFFPFVLSFISKKSLLKIQGFIAPFIDSIQVVLIFYLILYLFNGNIFMAIVGQIIYMTIPVVVLENSALTPRSLGYLNFNLAVLPLLFYIQNQNSWYMVLGLFFTTMLFLTHRFALQSFFFVSLFFTFYLNTPVFIQSLTLGFVLALIVTRGYYLRVLKGHLFNIYFWICNLDYRYAHQVRGILKNEVKTDLIGRIYRFLCVFSPIAMFGLNPPSFSAFIVLFLVILNGIPSNFILTSFVGWVLFFYILGTIVMKTKKLMPIGEGYRYMEMVTVPSVILSLYVFQYLYQYIPSNILIILLIFIISTLFLLIIYFQIKAIIKDRNRSVTNNLDDVFSFINTMKTTPRILCIPHQNTTMTIFFTKAQVLVNADNEGLMKITEVYPVLKKPIPYLAKKYNLTHALINEHFCTISGLKLNYNAIIFNSSNVKLVKLY